MAAADGGDRLAARLAEIGESLGKSAKTVKVGFLANATYPDGKNVAMIAATNEFGVPAHGQPPRPFFRRMIAEHKAEWPQATAKLLKANDYDAHRTLDMVGQGVKGQLQQSIRDLTEPKLADSTVKRKGHAKPLIASGVMLQAVDYKVDE